MLGFVLFYETLLQLHYIHTYLCMRDISIRSYNIQGNHNKTWPVRRRKKCTLFNYHLLIAGEVIFIDMLITWLAYM